MSRLRILLGLTVALTAMAGQAAPTLAASGCTPTGFYRDGINMTAKLVNPGNVSGTVDATGCNIGIYYGPGAKGTVSNADVFGANYFGIVNRQANVTVKNSAVHDIGETPFNGSQHGVGVYFATADTGSSSVNSACSSGKTQGKIESNSIYDYQKGGIVVNCDGTSAQVRGNDITGLGCVGFIAQNGIQFGYGATGQAMDNLVDGNCYTSTSWSSTGILMFEASGVVVQDNTVTNNQTGIDVESWCWFVQSASNNKIVNNTINGADWGVVVGAIDFDGYSTCDPIADNNKIVNNDISTTSGDAGVTVYTYDDPGSPFTPSADNNKVIANDISGFLVAIDDGGTSSKVHANSAS